MKHTYVLVAALIVLSGCSSVTVQRDYDPSMDFSALKTYAWKHEAQPRTGNPRIDNDLQDERIRAAIAANLADKGFTPRSRDDADFLVAYFMEYKRRISGNTWIFGLGSGLNDGYGGIGYNSAINDYDEGCLTIDIIGKTSGKTIWRGVGLRSTYENPDPSKGTEIVSKAVSRILADFPPRH